MSSGNRKIYRLSLRGNRRINHDLHMAAITQIRYAHSGGRAYYDRKIGEGKTHNEAMRCLKRRLADHVWRIMIADERRKATGPGGHPGATLTSSAAGSTPTTSSSDKSLPMPAAPEPTTSDPAA